MRKVLFTLAAVGIASGAAMAQTATIGGATNASVNGTFDPQTIITPSLSFQYGTLMATGAGTFTFTYLGNESGYTNGFRLDLNGASLNESNPVGTSATMSVGGGNLMPAFTFLTTNPTGLSSASNGGTYTDNSNPSFAIISNAGGGDVWASWGGARYAFQYVLGFNDAFSGDRDFDDYKVGVNFIAAPVPEPSTYALMLAGLVAVGYMARRRRSE